MATLSNAMDVANPSNFVRILEIFDNDYLNLKEKLEAVSVSDEIDRRDDARSLSKNTITF